MATKSIDLRRQGMIYSGVTATLRVGLDQIAQMKIGSRARCDSWPEKKATDPWRWSKVLDDEGGHLAAGDLKVSQFPRCKVLRHYRNAMLYETDQALGAKQALWFLQMVRPEFLVLAPIIL
jgi:hypothetical protein